MKKKMNYIAPQIEVITTEFEGGVMASSDLNMPGGNTNPFGASTRSAGGAKIQAASPLQELEDVLNDILTIIQ